MKKVTLVTIVVFLMAGLGIAVNVFDPASSAEKPKVTFIDLGSELCIPCQKMVPVMDSIKVKYPDDVKVIFYNVSTKEGRPFAKKYKIKLIPTQIFLDREGKEYFRHEGFFPLTEVEKVLKQKL